MRSDEDPQGDKKSTSQRIGPPFSFFVWAKSETTLRLRSIIESPASAERVSRLALISQTTVCLRHHCARVGFLISDSDLVCPSTDGNPKIERRTTTPFFGTNLAWWLVGGNGTTCAVPVPRAHETRRSGFEVRRDDAHPPPLARRERDTKPSKNVREKMVI